MIRLKSNQDYVKRLSDGTDKNASMVIIGDGGTEKFHKDIIHLRDQREVDEIFGNSPLSNSYRDAELFGCEDIFLINSTMQYDYIDISNTLMQYDFAYIVPTNILLTDYFVDPRSNNKVYYLEYMLNQISEHNNSHVIVTDTHGSLFDDIDDYITYMNNNTNRFYKKFENKNSKLNNISYVANNLFDFDYSNVILAATLCATSLKNYPSGEFREAVFDIDEIDTENMDFVFFQNNLRSTSIEHLFNLNRKNFLRKDVMIDRVIRYIERNLNFDEYIGVPYNGQQNITIRNKIIAFMDKLNNEVIENYKIKNIYFEKDRLFVGNIIIELEITPIGRAESLTILTKS